MATVVGDSCLIKGNLEGDEDLSVQGRVEGSINLTKTLLVEPSGIVKATVSVRNAVVNGVVVGDITASDSIELTDEARVVGDLTAPRVIIVDGASFRGQVDMGDLDMERPKSTRPAAASRPAPARAAPPRAAPAAAPAPAKKAAAAKPKASPKKKKAPAAPPKPPRRGGKGKAVKVKKKRR